MLDAIRRFAENAEGFDAAWMADDGLLKALYDDPELLEALGASVVSEGHLLAAEAYLVADGPQGALDVLSARVREVDDPVCFARLVEVFVDAPITAGRGDVRALSALRSWLPRRVGPPRKPCVLCRAGPPPSCAESPKHELPPRA